jgi:mono/diheme cytochrome c family protein
MRLLRRLSANLLAVCALGLGTGACSDSTPAESPSETGGANSGGADDGNTEAGSPTDALVMPAASTPVLPSPLTDQSRDLEAILEHGKLSRADCDRYFAGENARETSLRCGKWMFFYANIEVPGSPANLVDLVRENAPHTVGHSLEKLGLFPDPYSERGLPVGMTDGPDMAGGTATYTLSCGSCHFGKTTDGRYVVGSPNHDFAFGRYALTLISLPELALAPGKQLADEVEAAIGATRDEAFADPVIQAQFATEALSLFVSGAASQAPDDEAKRALAILPTGVMDPYSPPSLDDGVKIPVRMSPLWGIDPEGMEAAGSTHGAMLGSNGGAPDLAHILRTFAFIAGAVRGLPLGEQYDVTKLQPLIDYIMSLTPPPPEQSFDADELRAGQKLFGATCFRCHHGPGFAGTQVFDPRVIGTDPNIVHLVDKDDTGNAIHDVLTPPEITKGVRARRLSAAWSLKRLFHNGSAHSLSDVFCLDGPREDSGLGDGFSSAGHPFTCQGLSHAQKTSLIYFLQSL